MKAPINLLKKALKNRQTQFGCWINMASVIGIEVAGRAGFDWILIDAEHGPNGINEITSQLQVLEGLGPSAVVRVPIGETWVIKQVLDAGAQSILVPAVESVEQVRGLVAAVRYPPNGNRGVGSAISRAGRFGNLADYLKSADEQICLIVQLETQAGIEALDDMLAEDGIDGVFIGPSDLAADMGYLGDFDAPSVQKSIAGALKRISTSGKAAGILSLKDSETPTHLENGARMIGVASDVLELNTALRNKAQSWCNRK